MMVMIDDSDYDDDDYNNKETNLLEQMSNIGILRIFWFWSVFWGVHWIKAC